MMISMHSILVSSHLIRTLFLSDKTEIVRSLEWYDLEERPLLPQTLIPESMLCNHRWIPEYNEIHHVVSMKGLIVHRSFQLSLSLVQEHS